MTISLHVAVVERDDQCSSNADFFIVWNDFSDRDNAISLPEYIEKHADRLRSHFANFVEEVPLTQINGQSVLHHLLIRGSFSYWWMTLFAATRWDHSSNIVVALKLIALREIITDKHPDNVSVSIDDNQASQIIAGLVKKVNLPRSQNQHLTHTPSIFILRCRALISLVKYIFVHFRVAPLRTSGNEMLTVTDHFVRFDEFQSLLGNYQSQYWQTLKPVLDTHHRGTRWLHHFVPGSRSITATEKILQALRRDSSSAHAQFESRLTFRQFLCVVRDLRKLARFARISQQAPSLFLDRASALNFQSLFSPQWLESLCGSTATRHLIMLAQQETIFSSLPKQKFGLFLCENQPWEAALTYAWSVNNHEKLVAVVHAPIRFWDFRYLMLARSLHQNPRKATSKPVPDVVAINSPISQQFMTNAQASPHHLVEVESLMFGHLSTPVATNHVERNLLLIVGDFFTDQNDHLVSLVANALEICPTGLNIVFKPHPMNTKLPDFLNLADVRVSNQMLGALLPAVHTAITSNGSTAALECFASGVRTISILDPKVLNSSPLRSVAGASFATSSAQLAELLISISAVGRKNQELLFIDEAMTRWKKVLR